MTSRTHNAIAFASLITVSAFYPPESISLTTLIGVIVANIAEKIFYSRIQECNLIYQIT